MGVVSWICSVVLLILAIAIIVVVLLQEGHQANLSGAIAGGADSFLGKNKARTLDSFLAKCTKFIAIGFFVITLIADFIVAANL